jgi:hypothetical protein
MLMPILQYGCTVLLVGVIWLLKNVVTGGWFLYWGFATKIDDYRWCRKLRRYLGTGLGLVFMAMFAAGFFMNLYYLFAVAYVVLFWSLLLLSAKSPHTSID